MEKNLQKEKLEAKISRIAGEIFALGEKRIRAGHGDAEFKTLRTKLTDAVWRWASLTFGATKVEKAGVEIMQCVARCVANYKVENENESFLHYLSASLKAEIKRATERNAVQESRNITLPENKHRKLKQMIRYAQSCGKDISDANTQKTLSKVFGCTEREIAELVRYDEQTKTIPEQIASDDGEEISLLETALVFARSGYKTAEEESVLLAEIEHHLNRIDEMFVSLQERTKPYLSALLTHRVLLELDSARVNKQTIENLLCGKQFASIAEAHNVIQSFFGGGEFVTQAEVAAWFNRSKTDASRTMGRFLEKMEKLAQKVSTDDDFSYNKQ